jgi:hypothetical protein
MSTTCAKYYIHLIPEKTRRKILHDRGKSIIDRGKCNAYTIGKNPYTIGENPNNYAKYNIHVQNLLSLL